MDGNMYSPYQNNVYDLDNINVQDVDFNVGYDTYSGNYNFGDFTQDGLGVVDQRAPMKLKIDAANTRDLTSLQWLQSVSLPVDHNGSRAVQLMVDPNTNMPVQLSRTSQVVSLQQQVGIPQIQQLFSRSDVQEMANLPQALASKVQVKPGKENGNPDQKIYPKPVFSYSCLIAMALKNSETGSLPVSEIYKFMQGKFPYFKTAPDGWKAVESYGSKEDHVLGGISDYKRIQTANFKALGRNSVRHNLSLNKAFCKLERPDGTSQRKGCLWSLKPEKQEALEREIRKWKKKHPDAIKAAMANPDELNVSSDSMDDSMDEHSNTPEHTVPEVGVVKAEPADSIASQPELQVQQHFQSQQEDIVDAATADAAKDLFGNDIFQDMQAEDFWTDLLATSTSEPHLNFFDNVSDARMLTSDLNSMELENSVKLNGSQNYFHSPSQTQQTLAGM